MIAATSLLLNAPLATAVECNLELVTSNTKHFRAVKELRLKAFRA